MLVLLPEESPKIQPPPSVEDRLSDLEKRVALLGENQERARESQAHAHEDVGKRLDRLEHLISEVLSRMGTSTSA